MKLADIEPNLIVTATEVEKFELLSRYSLTAPLASVAIM